MERFAVSVIVPLCSRWAGTLEHLAKLRSTLVNQDDIQFIIVDNTPSPPAAELNVPADNYCYKTIFYAPGAHNQKTLNVMTGLSIASGRTVILMDDDTRPTLAQIRQISDRTPSSGILRPMVDILPRTWPNVVDLASVMLVNTFSSDRQFWGILAIGEDAVRLAVDMPTDTIFDELTLQRRLRRGGAPFVYAADICVPSWPQRDLSRFVEQRLRYTYENLAYPGRTAVFLAVLPALLALAWTFGGWTSAALAGMLAFAMIGLATVGWIRFGKPHAIPLAVAVVAPVWLFYNVVFVWVVVALRLTVGIRFAGGRLRKAA